MSDTTHVNALTLGNYATEPESCLAFDSVADRCKSLWNVYSEVPGQVLQPMQGCEQERVRIDRVLIPKRELIDAGWKFGAIGIEIKKSNVKLGRVICQCIDYRRSVFGTEMGVSLHLGQVFIFPFTTVGGCLETIMAQHRVGGVSINKYTDSFTFYLGQQSVLVIDQNSQVKEIKGKFVEQLGRSVGSR